MFKREIQKIKKGGGGITSLCMVGKWDKSDSV